MSLIPIFKLLWNELIYRKIFPTLNKYSGQRVGLYFQQNSVMVNLTFSMNLEIVLVLRVVHTIFITLHPVNYVVEDNKDSIEYIKRDILFQLIKDDKI